MFGVLSKLLGYAGKGASALPNELSTLLTGHAVTGGSAAHKDVLPAVGGYMMDSKAVPFGASPNTPYNAAVANNNQNLLNHVNPLQVTQPLPWQQGSLSVVQPSPSPMAAYLSPFDTDTGGMSPFMFGSRNNYQGTGKQINPQVPRPSLRDILNTGY